MRYQNIPEQKISSKYMKKYNFQKTNKVLINAPSWVAFVIGNVKVFRQLVKSYTFKSVHKFSTTWLGN